MITPSMKKVRKKMALPNITKDYCLDPGAAKKGELIPDRKWVRLPIETGVGQKATLVISKTEAQEILDFFNKHNI